MSGVLKKFALLLVVCLELSQVVESRVKDDNATSAVDLVTQASPSKAPRRPCSCADGQCGCCTGNLLGTLVGINFRQKGCMNVTYDPDEFSFDMKMTMNDRVMYQNVVSGKHPRPVCIPLPRLPQAKFCVRFSNVYFPGRNVHACIAMEGKWRATTFYSVSFDCIRMGVDGVSIVKPEAGGGLPGGVDVIDEEYEEEEEGEDEEEEEEEEDEEDEDVGEGLEDIVGNIASEVFEGDDDDDDDDTSSGSIAAPAVAAVTPLPVTPLAVTPLAVTPLAVTPLAVAAVAQVLPETTARVPVTRVKVKPVKPTVTKPVTPGVKSVENDQDTVSNTTQVKSADENNIHTESDKLI